MFNRIRSVILAFWAHFCATAVMAAVAPDPMEGRRKTMQDAKVRFLHTFPVEKRLEEIKPLCDHVELLEKKSASIPWWARCLEWLFPRSKYALKRAVQRKEMEKVRKMIESVVNGGVKQENWSANIPGWYYDDEERARKIKDFNHLYTFDKQEHSEVKAWLRRKIIFPISNGSSITLWFNPRLRSFEYFARDNFVEYGELSAAAMKYVLLYRCRDFFVDDVLFTPNFTCDSEEMRHYFDLYHESFEQKTDAEEERDRQLKEMMPENWKTKLETMKKNGLFLQKAKGDSASSVIEKKKKMASKELKKLRNRFERVASDKFFILDETQVRKKQFGTIDHDAFDTLWREMGRTPLLIHDPHFSRHSGPATTATPSIPIPSLPPSKKKNENTGNDNLSYRDFLAKKKQKHTPIDILALD